MDNDETIRQLFAKLNAKKAEIENIEKAKWCTHLSFRPDESKADSVNLGVVSDVKKLLEIATILLAKAEHWKEANKELGLNEPFKWNSFTLKDWLSDLKTRVNQLHIRKKKEEFAELEAKLNKLVSPEERRRIELEEIQKALAD